MKFLILFVLVGYICALTCDLCGTRDCCKPTICSMGCRTRGRNGGVCRYSKQEKRCICYCYKSGSTTELEMAEKMKGHKKALARFMKELNIIGMDGIIKKYDNKKATFTNKIMSLINTTLSFTHEYKYNIVQKSPSKCVYGLSNIELTTTECINNCSKYYVGSYACSFIKSNSKKGKCVCNVNCVHGCSNTFP